MAMAMAMDILEMGSRGAFMTANLLISRPFFSLENEAEAKRRPISGEYVKKKICIERSLTMSRYD